MAFGNSHGHKQLYIASLSVITKKAVNPWKQRLTALFTGVHDRNRTCGVSLRSRPDTTSGSGI